MRVRGTNEEPEIDRKEKIHSIRPHGLISIKFKGGHLLSIIYDSKECTRLCTNVLV